MSELEPVEEEHDPHYLAVINENFTKALSEYSEPHWFMLTPAMVPGRGGAPAMAIMITILRRGAVLGVPMALPPMPCFDLFALLDFTTVETLCRGVVDRLRQGYMASLAER